MGGVDKMPDGYEELLIQPNIGHLATVRPDGNPAVTPMWFSWNGELLRFTHTTRRAKVRNIESNPHIPTNTYRRGAWWKALLRTRPARSTSSSPTVTDEPMPPHLRTHEIR